MPYFDKHFTVDQANALLPEVREALRQIAELQTSLGLTAEELAPILENAGSNGGGKKTEAYLDGLLKLNGIVTGLTSQGILIKDLAIGLIDFPHMREGREVFLCWMSGEDEVTHWHDIDAGFAGRRAL